MCKLYRRLEKTTVSLKNVLTLIFYIGLAEGCGKNRCIHCNVKCFDNRQAAYRATGPACFEFTPYQAKLALDKAVEAER